MSRRYTAEEFASEMGYPNRRAFDYAMTERRIPPPDGVYAKAPYWSEATVKQTIADHCKAISHGFGEKGEHRGG